MNFKQINDILTKQNLNMNDIGPIVQKFKHLNIHDEKQMHELIKDISKLVHKEISVEDEKKLMQMIQTTKL